MVDASEKEHTNVDFEFERARGIVWVCDMPNSSANLNDDSTVDALEEFIPRLYWIGLQMVESAGGTFVKWTGDGFLAWFELPLERDLGKQLSAIFNAIWHLTALVNVTQLGVKAPRKFRVRHGVTYEPDAQLIKVRHADDHESLDLIGRSVVLAFRLSGMSARFPGIVTEAKLYKAYSGFGGTIYFRKRNITANDRLKFFKGQRLGTDTIYATADRISRPKALRSVVKQVREAIDHVKELQDDDSLVSSFTEALFERLLSGPDWAKEVMEDQRRWVMDDLLGSLINVLPILEDQLNEKSKNDA